MRTILILAQLALLWPVSLASAQPAAAHGFVTGGFFGAVELLSHVSTQAPVTFDQNLSGPTTGGLVGAGVYLAPRWTVQVRFEVTGAVKDTFEPPGPPSPFPASPVTTRVTLDRRTRGGSVLIGYEMPVRARIRIGYAAGIAFVRERAHSVAESRVTLTPPFPIPIFPTRNESTFVNYRPAAEVGADVSLFILPSLAIVPQVHAQALNGAFSVRPGIGARWVF